MRILHVIPSISPARGGPSEVIRTMAEALTLQEINVTIATTDDEGAGRMSARRDRSFEERGVTYWIFPRQSDLYTFSGPLTTWLWQNSPRYDLIHIHALFSYPTVAAAACATRAGVPFVIRPLGTLNRWGMTRCRPRLKRLSFRYIESSIIRRAAAVHYTSKQEAREAASLGVNHRSVIIPNPVNLLDTAGLRGQFRAKYGLQDKTIVLFLSRLDPKKGLDLLLPAFHQIHSKQPDAVLAIAGDGEPDFVDRCKQLAKSIGVERHIVWTGFLGAKQKNSAFADADLFVLPSYSENFGVAVVEAMSAGVPVIISDQVGIHREVSQGAAGLVAACDVPPLAGALAEAIGNIPWRREASTNGVRIARQFAPETIATRLTRLYSTILSQNDWNAAA